MDRWLLPAPEPQGGHGLGISTCSGNASQAGLICCNFNSCPRVSSVGQQLSTSPALSYTCFQLNPWSHSCPNVYMKASADLNRQEKQSLLLGWHQTNTASQVLFSKADPKHLFLPFKTSFENPWGERCLLFLAECVGLEKQGSEDDWCNGVSLVCSNVCPTPVLHQNLLNSKVILNINDSSWIICVPKHPSRWLCFLSSLLHTDAIPQNILPMLGRYSL